MFSIDADHNLPLLPSAISLFTNIRANLAAVRSTFNAINNGMAAKNNRAIAIVTILLCNVPLKNSVLLLLYPIIYNEKKNIVITKEISTPPSER